MEKILVINPAIASANLGDYIIEEVTKEYLKEWFPEAFFIDIPSHTPINNLYFYSLKDPTHTIVTGTNLLQNYPWPLDRQWDIKVSDLTRINDTVLFGPGWRSYNYKPHLLTKPFYKKLLHSTALHSVRDSYTAKVFEEMGFDHVINTSCPTTWILTPDFIKDIPTKKASRVVTTITAYSMDPKQDEKMLETLINNYETVYLWCQGYHDLSYYLKHLYRKEIIVLDNTLQVYKNLLNEDNLDFVGTRLHGGIYALRHKIRTIVISIDNRAKEIAKDIQLPILERDDLHLLEEMINSEWETKIVLPQDNIDRFINQFKKD